MTRPRLLREGVLTTGVHTEPPLPGPGRRLDGKLELYTAALGDDERRFEGQLLHHIASDLVTGSDRQVDEGRARQQDAAEDGVVGEPGVRVE